VSCTFSTKSFLICSEIINVEVLGNGKDGGLMNEFFSNRFFDFLVVVSVKVAWHSMIYGLCMSVSILTEILSLHLCY